MTANRPPGVVAASSGGGSAGLLSISRSTVRRVQWIGDDAERLAAGLLLEGKGAGRDEIGRVSAQLKAASALLTARTNAVRGHTLDHGLADHHARVQR